MLDDQDEEHIISIIASLFKQLKGPSQGRLLKKFTENNFEKIDRLIELHEKYSHKLHTIDEEFAAKREMGDIDEGDEEQFYLDRLEAGLFTLQMVDLVMAYGCSLDESIHRKVNDVLRSKGIAKEKIISILKGRFS